jgi:type I restriction enzyme S subunit
MSHWHRYPKYKSSGVEWLEEVPEGWRISKIKYQSNVNMGQSPDSEDCNIDGVGVPFLQGTAEFGRVNPSPKQFCKFARKLVKKKDILISVRAPVGEINIADQEYGIGRGLSAINCNNSDFSDRYCWYLLHHNRVYLTINSYGSTYNAVTVDNVKNINILLPQIHEQSAIAAFLDHEIARIDTIIVKKEQQIKLLQEKRASLICHTVTKGIDPNVKMKDSAIEWIVKIPEYWNEMKAKDLFRQLFLPPQSNAGIVTVFRDGQVTLRENRRTEGFTNAILEVGYQSVRNGDLVIHSMDAFAGAIGVSDSDGKCTGEYVVCEPIIADVNNYYYGLFLREMALAKYILAICPSVRERAPRFRFNTFKEVILPVPPIEEQNDIVACINKETKSLDKFIGKIRHSIDLLKEYRTTLIFAAATGKIDVREEVKA